MLEHEREEAEEEEEEAGKAGKDDDGYAAIAFRNVYFFLNESEERCARVPTYYPTGLLNLQA